ncbi:MAG: hypothetical protein ACRDIY_16680 [Chloroflexota bacterium]
MDITFERGSADKACGHALVYFSDPAHGTVLAAYVVVLPVNLELSRYVPPMLASQLPIADVKSMSAVPLPPVPEKVEGRGYLEHLADLRRDDLIDGGTASEGDVMRLMTAMGEICQRYAKLYEDYVARAPRAESSSSEPTDVTVNDVLYGLMSEQQRLADLAKLAGQLRYAVDGGDARQVEDLSAEMTLLARYLPSTYGVDGIVEAIKQNGSVGHQLSALYLDRCYKLANDDYAALERIDREIERLRGL